MTDPDREQTGKGPGPAPARSAGAGRGSWDGVERRRVDRRRDPVLAGSPGRRSGNDRRGLMYHARDFATRFREPLIGLGVAAASLPMIRTGTRAPSGGGHAAPPAAERAPASPEAAAAATTAAEPARDVDAEVGRRWGDVARSNTIEAAMDRYGISHELASSIYDHARNEGIDPKLAYGLVKTESAFRNTAVSEVGARGLTQLMPGTASWMSPGTHARDLFDTETSLRLGFRYLHHLIDRYDGDSHMALTAYNRGPGTVDRAVKRGRDPDNGYAGTVLRNALKGRGGTTGADGGQPG